VVSTSPGDANVLYRSLATGHKATDIPGGAFSVGKKNSPASNQAALRPSAAWNYFQFDQDPANENFIKPGSLHQEPERVTNDPMEAHVTLRMGQGVEKVK